MANIYIIAGPPGVGKSTAGYFYVPEDLEILDPDQIANRYKEAGFSDYKDIGNLKFQNIVRGELFRCRDFAIELNLGFQSHYDYIKTLKNFSNENEIVVILFFTDKIELCYTRAQKRHKEGLHYVSPEVIKEMYENTISLLKLNFKMISSITGVNCTDSFNPKACFEFDKSENELVINGELPGWAKNNLGQFLKEQIA